MSSRHRRRGERSSEREVTSSHTHDVYGYEKRRRRRSPHDSYSKEYELSHDGDDDDERCRSGSPVRKKRKLMSSDGRSLSSFTREAYRSSRRHHHHHHHHCTTSSLSASGGVRHTSHKERKGRSEGEGRGPGEREDASSGDVRHKEREERGERAREYLKEREDDSEKGRVKCLVFKASLPEFYYSAESDEISKGTCQLDKLHLEFMSLLKSFTKDVPQRCSFLPSTMENTNTTARTNSEQSEGGGDKRTEGHVTEGLESEDEAKESRDLLHQHIPHNHVSKIPSFHRIDKYDAFGKITELLDINSSPSEGWHCYGMTLSPTINFKFEDGISKITTPTGESFCFYGFSVLSRYSLNSLPKCTFERYGSLYTLELTEEPHHKNYTFKDVLLFEEYLFVKLLEIYDWVEYLKPVSREIMFVPKFCKITGDTSVILSMAEVLRYLVDAYKPLSEECFSSRETRWLNGLLVAQQRKVPSCIRIDDISRNSRNMGVSLDHYCSQLQRKLRNWNTDFLRKKKEERRELMSKKGGKKLSQKEHFTLSSSAWRDTDTASSSSSSSEDYLASLDWRGFHSTGLHYDIPQITYLLPLISHHILFHDSMKTLQSRIKYQFKNTHLLHLALTHSSSTIPSFMIAENHTRTALSNCGLRTPSFVRSGVAPRAAKGIKGLIEAVNTPFRESDEENRLQNNEQLEFLGDAVLEYICSDHLFHNHPDYEVGKLTHERQLLVKNKHLGKLAQEIGLNEFVLRNLKSEFTEESNIHIFSNCVEAILGAIYLDGGLGEADKCFAILAFTKEEDYKEWMSPHLHPLKEKYPDGDSCLLDKGDNDDKEDDDICIFKKMKSLVEATGIEFNHISLLTKAFVHSSRTDTSFTGGNYQRLEYLGDAILQFLVSKFVYERFPLHHEGHLSLIRTSLVHNKQLASISQELEFDKYVIISKTERVEMSVKIMADVVESFLAAVTLDQGLNRAEKFLKGVLYPKLKDVVSSSQLMDAKTRLNQAAVYTSKQQGVALELPVFRLIRREGPVDKPNFIIGVHMGKKKLAVGNGSTMREARSNAAELALQSGLIRIPPSQRKT